MFRNYTLSHTDDVTALPSGFAGKDRVYPGCHYRPEEIWWSASGGSLLRHTAWYWHRGNVLHEKLLFRVV